MKFIKEKKICKLFLTVAIVMAISFSLSSVSRASITDGIILDHYAWGENTGWVNFAVADGNIHVTDGGLTGYAWDADYGWMNLAPDYDGVKNDGNGNLSGYAWSSGAGYIDFSGVTINSSGIFHGMASSTVYGRINFDCDHCSVTTDWRPASVRSSGSSGSGGSSSSGSSINLYGGNTPITFLTPIFTPVLNFVQGVKNVVNNILGRPSSPQTAESSTTAPILALSSSWDLINPVVVGNFVLAPLPRVLLDLASAYPSLGKVFSDLGVKTIVDLSKLEGTSISIPTVANLQNLPTGILAAKTAGNLAVNSSVAVEANGQVEQKIQSTSNTPMTLSVRPGAPADSVTGYLIFQSAKPEAAVLPLNMETASALSAIESAATTAPVIPPAQLVLQTFPYTDPHNTGVYTATITTPASAGNYQVITLITYHDPTLGTKELSLTTVIDPEGYVYELVGGKEAHISGVTVSLHDANTGTLWNASQYNQTNPQTTNTDGKYSFLVPEGSYYITATAAGYAPYEGDVFSVTQGSGVHFNIEMTGTGGWLANLDWKTAFFTLLFLVICSAFAGYALHEHALKRELRRLGRL